MRLGPERSVGTNTAAASASVAGDRSSSDPPRREPVRPRSRDPDFVNLVTPSPTGSASASMESHATLNETPQSTAEQPRSGRHANSWQDMSYIDFSLFIPTPPPLTSALQPPTAASDGPRLDSAVPPRTGHAQNPPVSHSSTTSALSHPPHFHSAFTDALHPPSATERQPRDSDRHRSRRPRFSIVRGPSLAHRPVHARNNGTLQSDHRRSRDSGPPESHPSRRRSNQQQQESSATGSRHLLTLHEFLFGDDHPELSEDTLEGVGATFPPPDQHISETSQSDGGGGVDVTPPAPPLVGRPTDSASPHINEHSYSLVGQLTPDASDDIRVTEHSYSLASIGAMEAPPPTSHHHNAPNSGLRRSNRLSARLGPRLGTNHSSSVRFPGQSSGQGAVTGNATELSRTGTASQHSTQSHSAPRSSAASGDRTGRVGRSHSGGPLSVSSLAILRVPADLEPVEAEGRDGTSLLFDNDESSYTVTFRAIRPLRTEPSDGPNPPHANAGAPGALGGRTPASSAQSGESLLPGPGVNTNPLNVRGDPEDPELSRNPHPVRTTVQGIFGPFSSLPSSLRFLSGLTSADPLPSSNSGSAPASRDGPAAADDQEEMVANYVRTVNREAEILNQSLEFIDNRSRARRNLARRHQPPSGEPVSTFRVSPAVYAHEWGSQRIVPSLGIALPGELGDMTQAQLERVLNDMGTDEGDGEQQRRRRSSRTRPQRASAAEPPRVGQQLRSNSGNSGGGSIPGSSSNGVVPNLTDSASGDEVSSHTLSIPYQNLVTEPGIPAAPDGDVIVVDSDSDEVWGGWGLLKMWVQGYKSPKRIMIFVATRFGTFVVFPLYFQSVVFPVGSYCILF